MRQSFRALSLIALASILQGCVTPTPRITQTPSGAPEVVVARSVEEVRGVLIPHLLANGWQITSDYTNNIAVVQRMSAQESAGRNFSHALIDGKKDGVWSNEVNWSFLPVSGGTRIIARVYSIVQWPNGQTVRTEDTSNETFNAMQTGLNGMAGR